MGKIGTTMDVKGGRIINQGGIGTNKTGTMLRRIGTTVTSSFKMAAREKERGTTV